MAEPQRVDMDEVETREWLDSLEAVIEREGPERAQFLLEKLIDKTRRTGGFIPFSANTAYVNTIPASLEEHCPGNLEYEERLRSWMRWNAMAMVVRTNRGEGDLGGHISSFQSLANMLGIGFNHFWKGPDHPKATICSLFRAIHRPEFMPAPIWRAASMRINSITSVVKSMARAYRATHTRS